jgi:hypothetical protein
MLTSLADLATASEAAASPDTELGDLTAFVP